VGKFLSQEPRGTPFDEARNICGQRIGIASHKEMDMIWLNSQFDDVPVMLINHLGNDLL